MHKNEQGTFNKFSAKIYWKVKLRICNLRQNKLTLKRK